MFLIQSYPRCGTHLLRTALNSHGACHCYAEVLNPTWTYRRALERPPKFVNNAAQLVRWCQSCKIQTGFVAHAYVGLPVDFEWAGITPEFRARPDVQIARDVWGKIPADAPVVSLRRDNLLARYVSERIAAEREIWTAYQGQAVPPPATVKIDLAAMIEDFARTESLWRLAGSRFPGAIWVSYEELASEPRQTLERIQRHLALEVRPIQPATIKIGRPLRESIENYEEVADALRGTKWRYVLEQPE